MNKGPLPQLKNCIFYNCPFNYNSTNTIRTFSPNYNSMSNYTKYNFNEAISCFTVVI